MDITLAEVVGQALRLPLWRTMATGAVALQLSVAAAEPLVMFNRDRSASFPDARPVYNFDGQSGSNILWKARLPNWSNSSPIVAGKRVFVVAEPWQGYSPWLLCFDAETGKELWRRELDAVAQIPKVEQEATRKLVQETLDWWRQREKLWAETLRLYEAHKEKFDGWDKPPAEIAERWQAIKAEVEADGFVFAEIRSQAGGVCAPFRPKPVAEARVKRLKELGLMWNHWRGFGTWLGESYPTPCSDGRHVYTLTVHNLYSCHDLDGNLVWQVRFPPTSRKMLTPEQLKRIGDERWPENWPGQGGFSTSPVPMDLDSDGKNIRLISCARQMFRCLDAKDGREVWALPYLPQIGQAMGVPALARVDGEPVVIGCGHEGWAGRTGDEIIRVRDGQSVGLLPGTGTGKGAGNGPMVMDGDFVVTWKTFERAGWTL